MSDDSPATKIFTLTDFSATSFRSVKQRLESFTVPQWPQLDFNISLGWLWAPFISLGSGLRLLLFKVKSSEQLKMNLDEERFDTLIAHINSYIDSTIGQRLEESNRVLVKETSDKLTLIISKNVEDALVNHQYHLTENDIKVIEERIRKEIDGAFSVQEKTILHKISLTNSNFDKLNDKQFVKIQQQIKENVELHLSEIKLDGKNVDLNEIIFAVINSEKLVTYIKSCIEPLNTKTDQHADEIKGIKLDVANLKAEVIKRFSSLGEEIGVLNMKQQNLGEDFYKFKLENDEKLQKIMLEIDAKLVTFGDSHYTSIDASMKKNLLTVLGFDSKSSNGEVDEESIKNWVDGMFVAKSYLEERLKAIEENGNKAFKLQLDQNAGVLMNEINKEIEKQVLVAVAAKANNLKGSELGVTGGLSEADVLRIVKEVLAIYDADKTGLVDFALESAGGQVLSTR